MLSLSKPLVREVAKILFAGFTDSFLKSAVPSIPLAPVIPIRISSAFENRYDKLAHPKLGQFRNHHSHKVQLRS